MAEAIGAAAAALQLAALAKTAKRAYTVYKEIRDVDESMANFGSILSATELRWKVLERYIKEGSFDERHCRYSDLKPILEECTRAYRQLHRTFREINEAKLRSGRIGCYCRWKSSSDQIHNLREQITVCIETLQLPVILGKGYNASRSDVPATVAELVCEMEKLKERTNSLERSVTAQEETEEQAPQAQSQWTTLVGSTTDSDLESMISGLREDLVGLSTQQPRNSWPQAMTEHFEKAMQTLDKMQVSVSGLMESIGIDTATKRSTGLRSRIDTERDTTQVISAVRSLCGGITKTATTFVSATATIGQTKLNHNTTTRKHQDSDDNNIDFDSYLSATLSACGGAFHEDASQQVSVWLGGCLANDTTSVSGTSISPSLETSSSSISSSTEATSLGSYDDVSPERSEIVEGMMEQKKFQEAIKYLENILQGDRRARKGQRQYRLEQLANALVEAGCSKTTDHICTRWPDVQSYLDFYCLRKAGKLLGESRYYDIRLLLKSCGPVNASTKDRDQIHLFLIRCHTLIRLGQFEEAMPVLQELEQNSSLTDMQKGSTLQYLAEAYLLHNDTRQAKHYGNEAYNIIHTCNPSDDTQKALVSCILLMVDACDRHGDQRNAESWRQRLPGNSLNVRHSPARLALPSPSQNLAEKFHVLYMEMCRKAGSNFGMAADLVISYLKKNYEVDALSTKWYPGLGNRPPLICFDCIRQNVIEIVKLGSLPIPSSTENTLCTIHQSTDRWTDFYDSSDTWLALLGPRYPLNYESEFPKTERYLPCFTLLTFLAIADPISSQWPGRNVAGCVEEIKFFLKLGTPDFDKLRVQRILNTPSSAPTSPNHLQSDETMRISRTPVWMAATFGQTEVVKYFSSLGAIEEKQFSYEGLLRFPPCSPQGVEIENKINGSLVSLVEGVTKAQAIHLLSVSYTLWAWDKLPVFKALLSKVEEGVEFYKYVNLPFPMEVPCRKGSRWTIRRLEMSLVHCLVKFWMNTPIRPDRVLPILKEYRLNFEVKDGKMRTPLVVAKMLAKQHLEKNGISSGHPFIDDKPPALMREDWEAKTLQHIKTVQYLRSCLDPNFRRSGNFHAELRGTTSRLDAMLGNDQKRQQASEQLDIELIDSYLED